ARLFAQRLDIQAVRPRLVRQRKLLRKSRRGLEMSCEFLHKRGRGRSLFAPAPCYFLDCLVWRYPTLLYPLEKTLQVDDFSAGTLGVSALTCTGELVLCLLEQDVTDVSSLIADSSEARHEVAVCADPK